MASNRLPDDLVTLIIDRQRNDATCLADQTARVELLSLAVEVRDRREIDKMMVNQRQQGVRWPGGRRRK